MFTLFHRRLTRLTTLRTRLYSTRPAFNPSSSFKLTDPPNPNWKLGQGLSNEGVGAKEWKEDEKLGWRTWDLSQMEKKEVYPLLTSAVVPRPIAFMSTLCPNGTRNLAPMSYFSLIAHDPPLLTVSFNLPSRRPKDTRENIRSTKEFTVSIISEPFVEAANSCSVEAPDYVDEWIVSGLTPEPSTHVKPPRVKESAVSFECELFHFHDICPPNTDTITHTLVLGLIKAVHARNAVLTDGGMVDPTKVRAVSRLGGKIYARMGEGFELSRPSWKLIKEEYEKMSKS